MRFFWKVDDTVTLKRVNCPSDVFLRSPAAICRRPVIVAVIHTRFPRPVPPPGFQRSVRAFLAVPNLRKSLLPDKHPLHHMRGGVLGEIMPNKANV